MSDIRQEPVTAFAKKLRINEACVSFNKEMSVFKDWKEDNEETIRGCLAHDLRFWKVKKMCSQEDYNAIISIITVRFKALKEIFWAQTIENNTPPDFLKREFFLFCQNSGISD